MRYCYRLIMISTICLTLTIIALSNGKFDKLFRNASNYFPIPLASKDDWSPKLPSKRHDKVPKKLSDLQFYTSYHVKGFLRLVKSNLNEPIEVWYNQEHNQSRIDFYGGEVKTYQNGQLSLLLKIIPKYDSITKTHSTTCWTKRKTKRGKVRPQSVLPTNWFWPFKGRLDQFKHVGDEEINGKFCMKWQYEHKVMGRNNVYTYWVEKRQPPAPVRYEMVGYDTLLISYYDKYIIKYQTFEKWEYDKAIFKIPQVAIDNGCWNASEEEYGEEGEYFMNPIAEFTSPQHGDEVIDREYHKYKKLHGKVYTEIEHLRRKHIYRHNIRFINSINRRNLTYKLKPNSFADMTDAEYNLHKGSLPDHAEDLKREKRRSKVIITEKYKPRKWAPKIPEQLDWRKFGAVSTPRGQGTCGGCWAFAAIGAIEGANYIKTGKMVRLSEQQMIDCTWNIKGVWKDQGNHGCHGGMAWKVFFWAKSGNTLATSKSYGAYRGQEGYCKTKNITRGAKIYGFRRVKKFSAESLRRAIAYHGPAAVAINSRMMSLKFYSQGIIDDTHCANWTDHAVLVVGYGRENGVNYWLVRNSWSTMWGDGGYFKIRENKCGILNKPVVVLNKLLKAHRYPWQNSSKNKRNFKRFSHARKFKGKKYFKQVAKKIKTEGKKSTMKELKVRKAETLLSI